MRLTSTPHGSWQQPLLGVAMTIFPLSLAGFPFTGGFIGKVFILRAAVEKGLVLVAVVLVLASLMSYFYYLRVAWYMWFRDPVESTDPPLVVSGGVKLALAIAVAGVLLLGIVPGELLKAAEQRAASLFELPATLLAPPAERPGSGERARAAWPSAPGFQPGRRGRPV
jgi:NADH-quinone oxidoreductase subunit N